MFKAKEYGENSPEAKVQKAISDYMKCRDWFVKPTHGNMYQAGFPDLFTAHQKYGIRWIEVKLPNMKGSRFTSQQLIDFPKFSAAGVGIWILTAGTDDEYRKLFGAPNWHCYLSIMKP
ncbi:MAG TPA: hypothetical protein PLE74_01050 [Candidatus Cloacimonadota bacterium]|nr:hypothetical protein [Candidatus Cloacimonadota bacterium]